MFFNKSENQPEKEAEIELAKTSTVLPKAKVEEELQDFVEESEGQLAVDVYQTPTEIVIQSTVAGVDPENLDIAITNESLPFAAARTLERVKDDDYFYQECYWGRFARSVILPQEVDPEKPWPL